MKVHVNWLSWSFSRINLREEKDRRFQLSEPEGQVFELTRTIRKVIGKRNKRCENDFEQQHILSVSKEQIIII